MTALAFAAIVAAGAAFAAQPSGSSTTPAMPGGPPSGMHPAGTIAAQCAAGFNPSTSWVNPNSTQYDCKGPAEVCSPGYEAQNLRIQSGKIVYTCFPSALIPK